VSVRQPCGPFVVKVGQRALRQLSGRLRVLRDNTRIPYRADRAGGASSGGCANDRPPKEEKIGDTVSRFLVARKLGRLVQSHKAVRALGVRCVE
jgi:hypothetical protein